MEYYFVILVGFGILGNGSEVGRGWSYFVVYWLILVVGDRWLYWENCWYIDLVRLDCFIKVEWLFG